MNAFVSLEFEYRSRTYFALVHKRIINPESHYQITVMNSSLHSLLSGHDVLIVDETGELHAVHYRQNEEAEKLLTSIIQALQRQLENEK